MDFKKNRPKVFLETTILKYAVDRLNRLVKTEQTINWGGKELTAEVCVPATVLPIEGIANVEQKTEAKLLPTIAGLAFDGRIELLMQAEVEFELWRQRNISDPRGRFYGAPITMVDAPVKYNRVIVSGTLSKSPKELQVEFLQHLDHKRFKQLQKACGAYQGKKPPVPNELIDAFHVWCAETAGADYFLTCDLDLVDHVRMHKQFPPKVRVVKPSELLSRIESK